MSLVVKWVDDRSGRLAGQSGPDGRRWRLFGGAVVCLLAASPAFAAETLLDTIVVTDAKIPQPEAYATQQIDVITREEIADRPLANRNLTEIFRYEPGVFANPLSRNDANWGAFGGLGPKYNVYLVDGLPIDSFVDPMALDADSLERAEVFKGPASIMYGNYLSADFAGNQTPLAGITNLVLKDRVERRQTRIQLGGGSFGTWLGKVYTQGASQGLNYLAGASYERSDYTDYGTTGSWLNIIDDPEYEKTKLYLKTTYFFDDDRQRLSLFVNHAAHSGDAGRPNRDYDHDYDLLNLAYANQLTDAVGLQIKAGYRGYDRRWGEDNYPTDLGLREHDGVKQRILPADAALTIRHWGESLLTLGTDYQDASYRTYAEVDGRETKGNDARSRILGVYAQEKYVVGDWVLRGGLRYNEQHDQYDLIGGVVPEVDDKTYSKTLWSAGARYRASERLSLFANAGSSFVAPSAKAVGGTLDIADRGVSGKNGQLPNPGLQPESGVAVDLGCEAQVTPTISTSLRGFLNQVEDAIVENVISRSPSQTQSVNAGDTRAYGAELALEQRVSASVQWFANATYTQTEVSNDLDPDQDGSNIPFAPDWLANLGVTFKPTERISIIPYVQYVGHYYDSSSRNGRSEFGNYGLLNARLRGEISRQLALNLDLNNLTNARYELPWQFQDPGFSLLATVEFSFE